MSNYYVFKFLEEYLNDLNPATADPSSLHDDHDDILTKKATILTVEAQKQLQDLVFQSSSEQMTTQLIRKSHHALILLINRCFDMRYHDSSLVTNVSRLLDELLDALEQLKAWIHSHYNTYLTAEQLVPKTQLRETTAIISDKMELVGNILREAGNHEGAIKVVTNALQEFLDRIDAGELITKHEDDYHKALLQDIEITQGRSSIVSNCPSLHELLVYWNLNSKESIAYFTKGLEAILENYSSPAEQLDYLRLQHKYILQMPELPGFVYNPRYPSIKQHFVDYIVNEIEYLSHKIAGFLPTSVQANIVDQTDEDLSSFKVLSNLSGDQVGLIIRAGADTNIFKARSINAVFKKVVPYLSTVQKQDLSWQSIRNKAYAAEQRDKDIAISALQAMIEKIRGY